MRGLSNFDIFGLWMTAAIVFALPLAWLEGQDARWSEPCGFG
jgi:hypothetical protein